MLPFVKMHGLSNDFVIMGMQDIKDMDLEKLASFVCNRRTGIGGDMLIVLEEDISGADHIDQIMHIYNADGSKVGACGNATRCVARIIRDKTGKEQGIKIKTDFGELEASYKGGKNGDSYQVNMGVPQLDWDAIPLAQAGDTLSLQGLDDILQQYNLPEPCAVNMGNPHCVFFVEESAMPSDEALTEMGAIIETHPLFPERTNVEFVNLQADGNIRMRVWERGVGITQACGSGACAVMVAAIRKNVFNDPEKRAADIILDGGVLRLEWPSAQSGVLMSGAATHVFKGEISLKDAGF